MKKISLTNTADGELHKTLEEKREALRVFRFGVSGSRVKNVREGRASRRAVARVLTEIGRREKNSSMK